MVAAVSTHHLGEDTRAPRALQETFAHAFAIGHMGGFFKLDTDSIVCEDHDAGVQNVVDWYFDVITNEDAHRLAAIEACPVCEAMTDSFLITLPVVRA